MIARLAFHGAPIEPEHVYLRTFNGFAASARCPRRSRSWSATPTSSGRLPVRAAFPTASRPVLESEAFGPASGRRAELGIPGFDGTGTTIALLDTGVDLAHPFLRGPPAARVRRARPGRRCECADRTRPRPDGPSGTAPRSRGSWSGSHGPATLQGVAPGASLLPIRVAGWQPDASGGVAVYGRTDQLLAGLEFAVDPNQDGDAHDAARIALVGVGEPFAAFTDGPLARAVEGAHALDTLVVAAAGNDGPAGPASATSTAPAARRRR